MAVETVVKRTQGGPRMFCEVAQAFRSPGIPILDSVMPLMMAAGVLLLLTLPEFWKLTLLICRPNRTLAWKSPTKATCWRAGALKTMFLNCTPLPTEFSVMG